MDEETNSLLQPRQQVVNILKHIATIGSIITILIGFLCLLGWQFDIVFFKKSFLFTAIMNPLSAVGFIGSGCSLLLLLQGEKQTSRLKLVLSSTQFLLSIVTALIGFVMLLHFIGVLNFNLDQVLFADKLLGNKISPNSSINFFFIGIALLLLQFHSKKYFTRVAQTLTLLTGMISMFAVVGYIYNALSLYKVIYLSPVPLSSAITFSVLCISLLSARAEHGLTKILTRNTPSSTLAIRLIITILILPTVLGYFLLIGEQLNLYDMQTEIALLVIGNSIIFSVIVWINTRILQHIELENLLIKNQLEKNNIKLEINAKNLAVKTLSLEEENREVVDKLETRDKLMEIADEED